MISIRKSLTELERLEELNRATVECYASSIASAERHAIEIDQTDASNFRQNLQALESAIRQAATSAELSQVQASLDAELRDYRERAQQQIRRLRKEIEAAAAAVESFAGNLVASGGDHEVSLKRELQNLSRVASSTDLSEIRKGIQSATKVISTSLEQLRTTNQLAIAQLKDEIRVLHQQLHAERRPRPATNPAQGWSRPRVSQAIEGLLNQDVPFSVLLVVIRNLKSLETRHSSSLVEKGLGSLEMRFQRLAGGAVIGRWDKDQFAAVLRVDRAAAMEISKDAAQELSQAYLLQENGISHTLVFQVATGVIDQPAQADSAKFLPRLQQLVRTLTSA